MTKFRIEWEKWSRMKPQHDQRECWELFKRRGGNFSLVIRDRRFQKNPDRAFCTILVEDYEIVMLTVTFWENISPSFCSKFDTK